MRLLNQSKKCAAVLFACVFLLMLLCNFLTLEVADDFTYHLSFRTLERITNFFQIFPSLLSHAAYMNGRTVAHFWTQLFEALPKWIFNIVNSGIFVGQVYLLCRIGTSAIEGKNRRNNALIIAVFCALWLFQPSFGQANLWLDGACNYLWANAFGLVFILPFVTEYICGKRIRKPSIIVLYCLLSFFFGAHSENCSAAFIFMAALLLFLTWISTRKRPSSYGIIALVVACLGYLTIYLSPAELSKKGASFSLVVLRAHFITSLNMLKVFWLLLAVYVALLVLACACKVDSRHLMLSLVFVAGAMAANFIMTFASYYAERSASCVVMLLVGAIVILADKLSFTQYKTLLCCALAICMLPTCYHVLVGVNDIYNVYGQMKSNEEHVYACKEQGIMDVTIDRLQIETRYSAAYGLKYIDTGNAEAWPNYSMAKYYGINSIIGK